MKTTTGSLIMRGSNYYCFWRYQKKAFCHLLRDELGQPITRKADAEKAKDKLMEIVAKKSQVESLRSIQHAINDGAADIAALEEAQNPPLPLAQVWGAFLKSTGRNDCGKSTLGIYQGVWNRFLAWMRRERNSKTLLRDVDTKIAQAYLETLNRGQLAPATYNAHLLTLRYMFRVLEDEARLPENVWQKPKPKKLITQSRRELTIEELKKVCTSATGELRTLLSIGVYSGLRLGDCATLRWCEVDLRRNQIQRIPRKTARRSPKPITIPIHPGLRGILADIPAKERGEYVLPETANTYLSRTPSQVTRVIQQHFMDCGLKTTSVREEGQRPVVEVGFHSLRHSFVSMCREANVPLTETLHLKWSDVNWERKQLTIGSDGDTKNRTARRVDFNPPLEAHLEAMRTRRAPDSDWIFPSPQRGDRDIRVREAAELPAFGFHDCRHFLCSYCVMSGIDYMTTAQWAGHRDGGILISKVYGHLADEHTKAQAAKLVFTPPATRTNKEADGTQTN